MATDPVCGMTVDEKSSAGTFVYAGTTYYFCSSHCLEKFKANPEQFLKSAAHEHDEHAPQSLGSEAGVYVCPMDQEVRQSKPGPCPR